MLDAGDSSLPDAASVATDAATQPDAGAGSDAGGASADAGPEPDGGPELVDCEMLADFVVAPEEGRLEEASVAATTSGFVVVYAVRDGDRDVLRVALLDHCGGLVAESLPVDESGALILGGHVAALDEGFAVAWSKVGGDALDDGVVLHVFDAEGRPRGVATTVNETEFDSQFVTSAVALPEGVALAWSDWSPGTFDERPDVRFRIFGPDGAPLTREELLTRGSAGRQDLAVLGASRDGSLLAGYHESGLVPWVRRRTVQGRWLDDAPLLVSEERKQITSIASDGGHHALSIVSRAAEQGGDVELAILEAASGEMDWVTVSATPGIDEEDARVTAVPGGGWLVAWTDRSLVEDDSGRGVLAHRRFADGSQDGDRFLVPTATQGDQVLQAAATGPGGALVVWIDQSRADGRRGAALRARLLPHVVVEQAH